MLLIIRNNITLFIGIVGPLLWKINTPTSLSMEVHLILLTRGIFKLFKIWCLSISSMKFGSCQVEIAMTRNCFFHLKKELRWSKILLKSLSTNKKLLWKWLINKLNLVSKNKEWFLQYNFYSISSRNMLGTIFIL